MVKNLLYICVFLILLLVYIRLLEKRSLFIPYRVIEATPEALGLNFQEVYVKTEDGENLNAWYIPRTAAQFSLLFLHGNGGNLSHRLQKIQFFHDLGFNVWIVDYRGYGKSSGSPSEEGLYRDAQAAYDYLIQEKKVTPEKVIIFGESLGGAVAIDLAVHNRVRAMILEGVFTSVRDMARRIYPFLPTAFVRSKFDSYTKTKQLTMPMLFIHSRNDEVVPRDLGHKLYEQAPGPKEFVEMLGGHNDAFSVNEGVLREKIKGFMEQF